MAVLVAQGAPPDEVLLAVGAETTSLLGADATRLMRHEAPGTVTVIAEYGMHGPLGQRLPVAGSVAELVQRTSRAARVDSYDDRHGLLADLAREEGFHSSVAAPVMAEGSVWGSLVVLWRQRAPSPPGTEERLAQFAELVATAVANTESRAQLNASRSDLGGEAGYDDTEPSRTALLIGTTLGVLRRAVRTRSIARVRGDGAAARPARS